MSTYRIASRYAKSLIDLAIEQGKLDRVLEDVTLFSNVASHPEMAMLLKSPIVKPDKKEKVLDAIFKDKIDVLTHAFLMIILRKGRESQLADIAKEFINQYRTIKGISIVNITSAEELSKETIESIRRKLTESKMTHSNIQFNTSVDPSLIGGFVISFEDKLYDASIRHQLDSLRKQFSGKEYQAAI
jgi:F-type H+-transporting ATPase subunit delta